MPKLTIHTSTYNRGYILGKAYDSLCAQTSKDFEWIISDDGSTDNTEQIVKSWQKKDCGFTIKYYKLPRVGIPTALNNGIKYADSNWFMMLDSDDTILPNTVEKVLLWLEDIKNDLKFAGVGFMRCFPDGNYMKPQIPLFDKNTGYIDATHLERENYNLDMDSCEVHRIELMRKYPFKCWENELFAPEQLSLYEMAFDGYKLRWYPDKMYICEYLPDGLTKDNKIVKNNPMGFAMMYNQNILRSTSFKEKCYNAIQMIALCFYSKNLHYLKDSNNKLISLLVFPIGIGLGIRRQILYSRLK